MNNEVIFLYVLQAISGVIGLLMAYMVLKYLNHKALGMQTKVNLCSIKCPLYTVGERLGENRIFGFPQKYHVKTTQDSTQMTFGCQI